MKSLRFYHAPPIGGHRFERTAARRSKQDTEFMHLFSTKRNRLREAMLFQAPEANPHAFVQRFLGREQGTNVSYLGAHSVSIRGPVTGRTYHFAKSGVTLIVDRRDAAMLALMPDFKRMTCG
jgi:hypothetical protein